MGMLLEGRTDQCPTTELRKTSQLVFPGRTGEPGEERGWGVRSCVSQSCGHASSDSAGSHSCLAGKVTVWGGRELICCCVNSLGGSEMKSVGHTLGR